MNPHTEVMKVARIATTLIDAALAIQDIQGYLRDLTPPRLWTVEGIRRNPTCRAEWEHVTVIGGVGESLAAAQHKNWGQFLVVHGQPAFIFIRGPAGRRMSSVAASSGPEGTRFGGANASSLSPAFPE